ncbi:hypothetical protein HMPREF3229_01730 [Peptoniphilus harei]|uniref:Uncharacterized protein n=1 Tax=Peptoniphilus harei TaxID=54005 RepID=A0A133PJK9_9FIRM|nr:hypothetical protein HMPREF3229_01730 [Peptoniphilus harei]
MKKITHAQVQLGLLCHNYLETPFFQQNLKQLMTSSQHSF